MFSDLLIKVKEAEELARLEGVNSEIIEALHNASVLLRFRGSNKANISFEQKARRAEALNKLGLNDFPNMYFYMETAPRINKTRRRHAVLRG